MKNNKTTAVIYWIMSVVYILVTVFISISEGIMSKMVIMNLVFAVAWLIIGIIYWKKGEKNANNKR